jgi:hypothetical protein
MPRMKTTKGAVQFGIGIECDTDPDIDFDIDFEGASQRGRVDKRSASTDRPVGGCASLIRPTIVHVVDAPLQGVGHRLR